MLVHVGRGHTLHEEDMVFAASLDHIGEDTQLLIDRLRKAGRLERLGSQPRTFILYQRTGEDERGILTPTGMRTLQNRWREDPTLAHDEVEYARE
ncbi:MAG: hypothetical protein IJ229_04790 [Clostridia bacterium]|nr:hypothetical protein [Clostridia bacterium]